MADAPRPTETWWRAITPVFTAIVEHPFLAGLVDGSLPTDVFRDYLVQDWHYLTGYARALATLAARGPDATTTVLFAEHARETLDTELALHRELLADLGMREADVLAVPVSPTGRAYVNELLVACQLGSFAEGVAAVLPCYWVYWEVGQQLVHRGSTEPRYQRWIDTYADEAFGAAVDTVRSLADDLALDASPTEQARMRERFVTATRYEWRFWDAAWHRERWVD